MRIIDTHFFHVKDKGQFSLFTTIAFLLLFTSIAFYNNFLVSKFEIYIHFTQRSININLTIH